MPKSKKNKQVSLTHTRKNVLELKKHLVDEVRKCVDRYANIFVYSVNDMRNSKLKDIREEWKHSRFFFGKNKVMAIALGRTPEEEYRPNLHHVSNSLKGQCGLLFSNQSKQEVLKWFESYSECDFARSGNIATSSICLSEGPLPQFSHALEPYLRQLGLPTTLQKGVVTLLKDHQICKEGETLTPEMARLLKLLGEQMAEFRISIVCLWSNDGTFEDLKGSFKAPSDTKENFEMDLESPCDENMEIKEECGIKIENPANMLQQGSKDKEQDFENNESSDELDDSEKKVKQDVEDKEQGFENNESSDELDDSEKKLKQAVEDKEQGFENNEPLDELDDSEKKVKQDVEDIVKNETAPTIESSADEMSPIVRALRNRTIKTPRIKKK